MIVIRTWILSCEVSLRHEFPMKLCSVSMILRTGGDLVQNGWSRQYAWTSEPTPRKASACTLSISKSGAASVMVSTSGLSVCLLRIPLERTRMNLLHFKLSFPKLYYQLSKYVRKYWRTKTSFFHVQGTHEKKLVLVLQYFLTYLDNW